MLLTFALSLDAASQWPSGLTFQSEGFGATAEVDTLERTPIIDRINNRCNGNEDNVSDEEMQKMALRKPNMQGAEDAFEKDDSLQQKSEKSQEEMPKNLTSLQRFIAQVLAHFRK